MLLGMEVNRGPGDLVLDGDHAPSPKKGTEPPNFRPMFIVAKRLDGSRWHLEVSLSPGDFLLDTGPSPSPKKGRRSQFSAHVYCGQTAAWIKMPLGTEVRLGSVDIVLDGDPAPTPQKGGRAPNFRRPIFIEAIRLDASRSHLVWR